MTLIELKKGITEGRVPEDLIIFVLPKKGNTFLADSYIAELCRVKNCNTIPIESIYEPFTSALAMILDYDSNLAVLKTETFEEPSEDYSQFKNTIVVCEKVDKEVKAAAKDFIIEIPDLKDWHIIDFIKQKCSVLDDVDATWLYTATGGDLNRIIQELDKVLLFPQSQQKEVFIDIKYDPCSDLHPQSIFDLVKAVSKRNKPALLEYFCFGKHADYDPIALVNILLKEAKNALFVIYSGLTSEELDMKPNQMNGIRYGNSGVSVERLQKYIEFLSNIDLRLKSSELDMSKERLIDYVICHLLAM